MLTVLDEYSRECLAILVARRLQADDVLEALTELFVRHGPPAHIRSDNGPEFTATVVRGWLKQLGVRTLFITPASPWENGYNESFNGTLGEELLSGKSSIRWRRRRCSSNSGGASTTPSVLIALWATGPRLRKRSSPIRPS